MCAIVDNNVVHEVFGNRPPEAGKYFRHWLGGRNGRMVVGGRLLEELKGNSGFREWFRQNELSGHLRQVKRSRVEAEEQKVRQANLCRSDDEHVVALALVSGARLLYTNDGDLIKDFKNRQIIAGGKVYTTDQVDRVTSAHKRLLTARDICRRS